jgi:arabinogalactan oligomer/maltooligosaccharide transport system substrate-binding protein
VLIRRKSFLALGAAGASAALLAACGSSGSDSSSASDAGAASDGGSDAAPKADANADLVIWADEAKATALKEPAEKWGTDNGLKVAVQTVANDLQTSFVTANQAGNGPDIVMGAHDWIGNLVQNGAISTVQLPADAKDTTLSVALDAMQYNGQTYGVPYAVETLVLFANKKLTDTPEPKTFEELVEAGTAGGADNVLSLPVGEEGDAYHMEPLYTSAGGYLFGKDSEGSYDPTDLGVGKEGSIAAGEKMKELGKKGVLKTSITGDNAISLFTDGKAAYLISGPWAIADIKKAKIDFALSAVPGFEGMDKAVPFAGVNGFYAAANGKNAGNAQTFLVRRRGHRRPGQGHVRQERAAPGEQGPPEGARGRQPRDGRGRRARREERRPDARDPRDGRGVEAAGPGSRRTSSAAPRRSPRWSPPASRSPRRSPEHDDVPEGPRARVPHLHGAGAGG